MASFVFPERPRPPVARSAPIELVVRRLPLAAIRQVLAVSIDDIVNDARCKRAVQDLYRMSRRIDDEAWLRRQLADWEATSWILEHL